MKETRTTIQGDRLCVSLRVVRKPALLNLAVTAIHHGIGSFRIPGLTDGPLSLNRRRIPRWWRNRDAQPSKRSGQGLSAVSDAGHYGYRVEFRPNCPNHEKHDAIGHLPLREISVSLRPPRLCAVPTTGHHAPEYRLIALACARTRTQALSERLRCLRYLNRQLGGIGTHMPPAADELTEKLRSSNRRAPRDLPHIRRSRVTLIDLWNIVLRIHTTCTTPVRGRHPPHRKSLSLSQSMGYSPSKRHTSTAERTDSFVKSNLSYEESKEI